MDYEQKTVSAIGVVIETGIFATTARTLVSLLQQQYFYVDAGKAAAVASAPT